MTIAIAVLVSVGRHPASGRARRADRDARAIELALRLSPSAPLHGQAAVERACAQDFDIIFMDVRMPVMNGVDSFFVIRSIKPQARVVMMTGFKERFVERALQAGAEGPLHKPFAIDEMLALIERGDREASARRPDRSLVVTQAPSGTIH